MMMEPRQQLSDGHTTGDRIANGNKGLQLEPSQLN